MPDLQVKILPLNTVPRMPIWTRLGYREKTAAKDEILPKYEPIIERFVMESKVRVFYMEKAFSIEQDVIVLPDYRFQSNLIRERFSKAEKVFCLGASVMLENYTELQHYQEQGNMEMASILDAVLSEKVDFGLDFIEQEIGVETRRTGCSLGRRLSCGYGDFFLSHQQYFFKALNFAAYGITINDRNILFPEKTVTALLPVFRGDTVND
ncbi:hypothetical protein K8S19_12945 [bacterium]|nr:hypothetical protein [bacterium]